MGEWIEQFLVRRSVMLSVLLAAVTVLAWGARWHWALDLLSHFPVQIAATATAPLAVFLGFRRWKTALLPAAVFAINAAQLAPLYLPAEQPSYSGGVLRAISANVLRSNRRYARFLEYLRTEDPDFFLVMEVNETWLGELEPLHREYPYRLWQSRRGNFGIAFYSRLPMEDHAIIQSAVAGVPMIRATLVFGEQRFRFLGVHPLPPIKSGNSRLRNGQLQEIAALSASMPGPKLILGDLNVTSWSPHFRDLLEQGEVRDARRGFGIQPTWPKLPWLARIPIDHTLVSEEVEVVGRRMGPDIGSDHRPVELDFRIGE